jgi:hypothetical protein
MFHRRFGPDGVIVNIYFFLAASPGQRIAHLRPRLTPLRSDRRRRPPGGMGTSPQGCSTTVTDRIRRLSIDSTWYSVSP